MYSYFFQIPSISEIIFTIIIIISYFHTIFRQFQLFNIIHFREIAVIIICTTYILAQSEIFDAFTYLLPRTIIISLQYVKLSIFKSSLPIGKCNTINFIQIYITIAVFGQFIFFITFFILYSISSNKIFQCVMINIICFLLIIKFWLRCYLNIIRPFSRLTILIVKLEFVVILVR